MSVLVIGAGVIGLSVARELHRRGFHDITVIERGRVGREASWAAAGMLATGAESNEADDLYRFCSASNRIYTSFAAELIDETGVDIELNNEGTLSIALSEHEAEALYLKHAKQVGAGIRVERLSASEALKVEPNLSAATTAALFFPDDRQVENRKLLKALQLYAQNNQIRIVENVTIDSLLIDKYNVTGAVSVSDRFATDLTIVATGAWTSFIELSSTKMPFEVRPIRGQMIAYEGVGQLIRKVIYSGRGYLVPRADGRLLAGATVEDVGFDDSTTAEALAAQTLAAVEILPALSNVAVADHWSGLRPFAPDALPVIGKINGLDGLIVATAHYRNGILLAPITAEAVAGIAAGSELKVSLEAFSPDRFSNTARSAAK